MEVYTLTISFPYDDNEILWSRKIEVKEDFTLQNLHKLIQKIVDFDDDHLYEFYVGRNYRNRASSIPKKTKLNEIYPLTGYKMYYHFDFGDSGYLRSRNQERKR